MLKYGFRSCDLHVKIQIRILDLLWDPDPDSLIMLANLCVNKFSRKILKAKNYTFWVRFFLLHIVGQRFLGYFVNKSYDQLSSLIPVFYTYY